MISADSLRVDSLRAALIDDLAAHGWLTSEAWKNAFAAVPRHVFLTRFFALTPEGTHYEAIDESHPTWLEMTYRNAVWPTQLDGDPAGWQRARDTGPVSGEPSCSSTQPSLMAIMLEALDVQPRQRVLEIGTGTGYNAALLAHHLGAANVTTMDVDPTLTIHARANLDRAGYHPTVLTADGEHGHLDGAPYDRLIATCSVAALPSAWLHQVHPGGTILVNLYRQLASGSLARLTVRDDGTASGRLLDDSGAFMPLRAHQSPSLWGLVQAAAKQEGATRQSALPEPVSDNGPAWMVLADLLMPGVARTDITRDDGAVQWLVHPDGSWSYYDTETGCVEQGGPRQLWDDLEQIHAVWVRNGKPNRDRIGITVTATANHHIWLHDETNTISLNH